MQKFPYKFFVGLFFLIFLFLSCKNDPTLGIKLVPDDKKLNAVKSDTATINVNIIKDDSILTDETLFNLVGSYWDPVFGKSKSSFYTQLNLPTNNVNFGDPSNLVADSLVLYLVISDFYGTLESQKFLVYEILEDMNIDNSYYSKDTLQRDISPLATISIIPNPFDSVLIGSVKAPPLLRIPLSISLAKKILNQSGTSNLMNNSSFQKFFKGIFVTVDNSSQNPGEGAILYINLLDKASKMTLYYKEKRTINSYPYDKNKTYSYDFEINSSSARFNHFEHNYTGTVVEQSLNSNLPDTSSLYIQAMGGTKAFIRFPYIKNFAKNKNLMLNKAELILTMKSGTNVPYGAPEQLSLIQVGPNYEQLFLPDFYEGTSYFGGNVDLTTGKIYFTITRFINQLINKNSNSKGLYLVVSGASIKADRIILNGTNRDNNNRLKLNLIYTENKNF